jgi:hypothetical protein
MERLLHSREREQFRSHTLEEPWRTGRIETIAEDMEANLSATIDRIEVRSRLRDTVTKTNRSRPAGVPDRASQDRADTDLISDRRPPATRKRATRRAGAAQAPVPVRVKASRLQVGSRNAANGAGLRAAALRQAPRGAVTLQEPAAAAGIPRAEANSLTFLASRPPTPSGAFLFFIASPIEHRQSLFGAAQSSRAA